MDNVTFDEYVIGIDFGMMYFCVFVWRNGEVYVLMNVEGDCIILFWVVFIE